MIVGLLLTAVVSATGTLNSITPKIFSPGVISSSAHDSAPAFSPDGETVYFGRSNATAAFILVARRKGHGWTAPMIAPFSGTWLDMEPAMAPDGAVSLTATCLRSA